MVPDSAQATDHTIAYKMDTALTLVGKCTVWSRALVRKLTFTLLSKQVAQEYGQVMAIALLEDETSEGR